MTFLNRRGQPFLNMGLQQNLLACGKRQASFLEHTCAEHS